MRGLGTIYSSYFIKYADKATQFEKISKRQIYDCERFFQILLLFQKIWNLLST